MYRVYLSSTIDDLSDERTELSRWLITAGHQPVESYTASTEKLLTSCFSDIATCDLFVLLLGDRYGAIPYTSTGEALSVTHLEYLEAQKRKLPCMVFMRTSSPNKALSDLADPIRRAGYNALREEIISHGPRPAEFKNSVELISVFSASFHQWIQKQSLSIGPACINASTMTGNQPLTAEAIARAVHRSAVEGLSTPRDWFENWSGEVFNPPLPPSHALLQSCFIDTGLRARVIAKLKAGGQAGITGFIGMGGVGKTFTALRIAWDLLSEGWQICWVSLLQRSANDVLDDIAQNFGFRFVPNLAIAEKVAALRTTLQLVSQKLGKVLIVLDNAEQFPDFAEVVGALSHLPVLVTSRTNEQAGRIRYERIEPLTQERAVAFCEAFLNANRESEQVWKPTTEDCGDLVSLAELYKGHPLSIRMALTGYLRLPRAVRTSKRPLLKLLKILKDRGLNGFADENATVYSADEPSEKALRSNMEATFQWLYDDLSAPTAPLPDRGAFLLLPLCAAVGAATFDLETVSKAVFVLQTLLHRPSAQQKADGLQTWTDITDFPGSAAEDQQPRGSAPSLGWHNDVRQLAVSRALILEAIYRLEHISLVDPVPGQTETFTMHPTVREFSLRQEDPSESRRPSSDMLLRAALGTLVEGINVSDALLNLLPWLKGRRSLVQQACDNLVKRWRAEEYRSYRTTRVWAEAVLELVQDIGLTEQNIDIQCRLGELLDRMEEPSGLPMLHGALQLSEASGKKNAWPAFAELTVPACLNSITPHIYSDKRVAWSAIYLATSLANCAPSKNFREFFEALRWALDEDLQTTTWNRLGPSLCESLGGGAANIVNIQPFDQSSTNAFLDVARMYWRWAHEGFSPELAAAAKRLIEQVEIFPPPSLDRNGLITPQHWISLRTAYLGFSLLQDRMKEEQFLGQVSSLREFSLAQGIRAFRLEYQCSLLLAQHSMQHEHWPEAVKYFRRAIAATYEIRRHGEGEFNGRLEMLLLQSACISLSDSSSDHVPTNLQTTEHEATDGVQVRLLPYIYIAQACRSLKDRRIAECHSLAQKAVAELQTGSCVPMYLQPLLQRLTGPLQIVKSATRLGPDFRADWNHLPAKVISTSDGRSMSLVHHGIGVLMDGKKQAWLWPFYIDDAPLTLKDVRELARRSNVSILLPHCENDEQPVDCLYGRPLAQLLNQIGKTFPTAQERFAAAAQTIGVQRWSSDDLHELDRFNLVTVERILSGKAPTEEQWVERINNLLQSRKEGARSNGIATKSAKRSVRLVSTYWSGRWINRAECWQRAFETSWAPRFQSNSRISRTEGLSLARHTLASLSLSFMEKLRVATMAPTLSHFQVTELIKTFSDERMEFEKLWPTEGEIIRGLVSKSLADAKILLETDMTGLGEDFENVVIATPLTAETHGGGDNWHFRIASREQTVSTKGAALTNGDGGYCVRLVRPILTQSDMEGLVPVESTTPIHR